MCSSFAAGKGAVNLKYFKHGLVYEIIKYFLLILFCWINLNLQNNSSQQINVLEWKVQYFHLNCRGVDNKVAANGNTQVPQIVFKHSTWGNALSYFSPLLINIFLPVKTPVGFKMTKNTFHILHLLP